MQRVCRGAQERRGGYREAGYHKGAGTSLSFDWGFAGTAEVGWWGWAPLSLNRNTVATTHNKHVRAPAGDLRSLVRARAILRGIGRGARHASTRLRTAFPGDF